MFGHALTEPSDEDDAATVLDAVGLSYLADRWLLTLPVPTDRLQPER